MLPQMSFNFNSFYQTWLMLDEKIESDMEMCYLIPWIVNGAFACEVGMKYILVQNKIVYTKEHFLHELYNLLPDKHKEEISRALYEQYPGYTWEYFNQEILLLSDSFCDFRYSYEKLLVLDMKFFKIWCQAIFKQVNTYPIYVLNEHIGEPDITIEELDEKILKAQNEMLENLSKKGKKHGNLKRPL